MRIVATTSLPAVDSWNIARRAKNEEVLVEDPPLEPQGLSQIKILEKKEEDTERKVEKEEIREEQYWKLRRLWSNIHYWNFRDQAKSTNRNKQMRLNMLRLKLRMIMI